MDLIKEYTDVHYASKKEIAKEFGVHLVDAVWNQIMQYRKEFMISIEDVDFCLCPGILLNMVHFHELLHQDVKAEQIEGLIEHEEAQWMAQHFLKTQGTFRKRLHELCVLFHSLDETRINAVMDLNYPVMCKVTWILLKYEANDFSYLLLILLLSEWHMKGLLNLIEPTDFHALTNKDGTYLLSMLMKKCIQKNQLNHVKEIEQKVNFHELMYQYPQLKKYQIEFYLDHHEPGFYYTIEQFIEYSDVCYETGRCALKQLADLGFYQMMKLGKKFVYTAR